jgi:phosphatidylserine decarboxylase
MDTTLTTAFAPGLRRWALPLLAGAAVALVVLPPAVPLLLGLVVFVVWFFRDPERDPPESGVLAPADGHVSVIREDGDRVRVGVFMSPFDVHVTRAPVEGTVARVDHRSGGYKPAFSKDSERNERVEFGIDWENNDSTARVEDDDSTARVEDDDSTARVEDEETTRVDGALIAGWFARRITPYIRSGETVRRGQRIGHIAFGSRADVVLPPEYDRGDVRVTRGEEVRAGETVLAERDEE